MATTRRAPCLRRQSVKPPVDEPISMHLNPVASIPNLFRAASNFNPPRLIYLFSGESPLILIAASAAKSSDGFATRFSSTSTTPDITSAWALVRESAKPPLTSNLSMRSRVIWLSTESVIILSKMETETKLDRFAKYAWFVLAFNIVVILWGVFLRASKSGDGCGQHWLTCQGEVIPSAPELKTIIEFSHRVTSSMAGILLIVLLVWAFWRWRSRNNKQNRLTVKAAFGSLVFVVIEGLLGAGLVLTGNTAENLTPERPFWMAAHLINTLIYWRF